MQITINMLVLNGINQKIIERFRFNSLRMCSIGDNFLQKYDHTDYKYKFTDRSRDLKESK